MNSKFHYVYILSSVAEPDQHYTGMTTDIEARLEIQLRAGVRQKTLLKVFAAGTVYAICKKWFDRHRLEKLLKNCPTIPGAVIFV